MSVSGLIEEINKRWGEVVVGLEAALTQAKAENEKLKERIASSDHFFDVMTSQRDKLEADLARYREALGNIVDRKHLWDHCAKEAINACSCDYDIAQDALEGK